MDILTKFRTFNQDGADMDELVALHMFGQNYVAQYEQFKMTSPDWITDRVKVLKSEIFKRRRDYLEKTLRSKKLAREALRTPEQKRQDLDTDIAQLEAELKD